MTVKKGNPSLKSQGEASLSRFLRFFGEMRNVQQSNIKRWEKPPGNLASTETCTVWMLNER